MALANYFRDQFAKAVDNSVSQTSELEEQLFELAQLHKEIFLPSDVPRGPLRTYVRALLALPPIDLGLSDPEPNEAFTYELVREEPCFRSLLVATVLLRLIHNEDWNALLPDLPDTRSFFFRKLSVSDTACLALLMNQTFVGKVDGVTCQFVPFLCRLAKKAGVRVTAPLENSPPREWQVTFAERAFLQRKERLPSFLDAKTAGQALGCVLRDRNVMLVGCHHLQLLSMKSACEMAIAFHLPTSENVSFTEVRLRPTADSVTGLIEVFELKDLEKEEE